MKTILLLLAFVLLFFGVWDFGWKLAGVPPLFPWQLKRMLREEPEKVVLLDVRTPAEYNLFHIPNALHVPDLLTTPSPPTGDSPDKLLVLVCMTGHRSPVAARLLKAKTKGQVVNLTWGMLGWLASFGKVSR